MSNFSEQALRWVGGYHGSIDTTALLMAFDAGRRVTELMVSSRDALAKALMEHECPPYYWGEAVLDSYASLADHLLASGVVRVVPDVETVAKALFGLRYHRSHWLDAREPEREDYRRDARRVLALFTEGAKE